jgi:hypothetical protein
VFTGRIGTDGRVETPVPRGYLLVGRPTRRGGVPVPMDTAKGNTVTITLPPESSKK